MYMVIHGPGRMVIHGNTIMYNAVLYVLLHDIVSHEDISLLTALSYNGYWLANEYVMI